MEYESVSRRHPSFIPNRHLWIENGQYVSSSPTSALQERQNAKINDPSPRPVPRTSVTLQWFLRELDEKTNITKRIWTSQEPKL